MDDLTATLWTLVLIPTGLATCKNAVIRWYNEAFVYLIRPFDTDRDPNTPEVCRIVNAAGVREKVIIHKYKYFGLSGATRGVWYSYVSGTGSDKYSEPCHVSLTKWDSFLKTGPRKPLSKDQKKFLADRTIVENI